LGDVYMVIVLNSPRSWAGALYGGPVWDFSKSGC